MASGTYDYESEQQRIARQRQLADALMQGGLSPSRQIDRTAAGGRAIAFTPLEGIADIVQVLAGKRKAGQADEQQQALTQRYHNDLVKGMQQFQTTSEGVRVPDLAPRVGVDPANPPMIQQQAPNPRKAVLDALSSNHPVLREMAMQELRKKPEPGVSAKDLLQYADPSSIPDIAARGVAGFKPKAGEIRNVNGILYNDRGEVVQLKGPQPTLGNVRGTITQVSPSTGLHDPLDKATRVNVNASPKVVMGGQKAGMEAYFKNAANQVDKLGQVAGNAQSLLSAIDTLESLHNAGVNSNMTSGLVTAAQNLGQSLGMKVDAAKLANTEAAKSVLTELWQRAVSQYGGNKGVTKDEAMEVKRLTAMLEYSPEARAKIFQIQRDAAARQIAAYSNANRSFAEAAAADDPRLFKIPDDIASTYTPPAGFTQPTNVASPTGRKPTHTVTNW
jgi:hypothetical protein